MGKMDLYAKLKDKADNYKYLHHFTSIENFERIISDQKLLLNRLDRVKDKNENAFLPNLWNCKVFACCFTHSEEGKERFWNEYAKKNGVRISFPNSLMIEENYKIVSPNGYIFSKKNKTDVKHKQYERDTDWACYDISKVDIRYVNNNELVEWKDCSNALVKEASYNWEEETRIRVAMDTRGMGTVLNHENIFEVVTAPFEIVFLEMSEKILSKIFVSVPDYATDDFIFYVRKILRKCNYTANCKIYRLTPSGTIYETGV